MLEEENPKEYYFRKNMKIGDIVEICPFHGRWVLGKIIGTSPMRKNSIIVQSIYQKRAEAEYYGRYVFLGGLETRTSNFSSRSFSFPILFIYIFGFWICFMGLKKKFSNSFKVFFLLFFLPDMTLIE